MCVGCLLSLGVVPNISTASSCVFGCFFVFFLSKSASYFLTQKEKNDLSGLL